MSLPDEERRAMRRAWEFLLELSSGEKKIDRARPVREEARYIVKHFPLGGRPEALELAAIERGKVYDGD